MLEIRKTESKNTTMKTIYISGALTIAPGWVKPFYEDLAARLRATLEGVDPYVPHLHSDPVEHAGLTPKDVYELDVGVIRRSSLVVAYLGTPSLGVGMEIEYAKTHGIPVLGFWMKGERVGRIARGMPGIVCIEILGTDHVGPLTTFAETMLKASSQPLVHAAEGVRSRAFTTRRHPDGGTFKGTEVACALRGEDGVIYTGVNVEQRWQTGTVHAEPAALADMVKGGCERFTEALISADVEMFTPCGGCRDWLRQFAAPGALVHFHRPSDGEIFTYTLEGLLPAAPRRAKGAP